MGRSGGLRVAGLFAGIGGMEEGLSRAGHHTEFLCERDEAARAVLTERFPGVPLHHDVTSLDELPPECDLVAAGFPCQDLSQAGSTRGIFGPRSWLVERVFELLEVREVPWVLLENVPFMLRLRGGSAIAEVTRRLEELGYSWAYRTIDSRSFGLPQRRQRVFVLASLGRDPRDVLLAHDAGPPRREQSPQGRACGFYWTEGNRGSGWAVNAIPTLKGGSGWGIPSPPAILLPSRRRIVIPDLPDAERLQGFRAGWTDPAGQVAQRGARWRLIGNAVSVPVATWIGQRLADPGEFLEETDAQPVRSSGPWPSAAWNVGDGAFACDASAWPLRKRRPALARFLEHPGKSLSSTATAGFLGRLKASRLKLRHETWFIGALERHARRMCQATST